MTSAAILPHNNPRQGPFRPAARIGIPISYQLSGSSLDWGKVWIVPEDRLQDRLDDPQVAGKIQTQMRQSFLPAATGQDHYAYARETGSALVYVERPAGKGRSFALQGSLFEKFLFYRGLGNFDLPLKLTAYAADAYALENVGPTPIRSLFLVTVEDKQLRYTNRLKPGGVRRHSPLGFACYPL